jgi:hypothetical protein
MEKIIVFAAFGAAAAYLVYRVAKPLLRLRKKKPCGPDCKCD